MKKIFTFLLISLVVCNFCYTQGMQEPSADGIYLIGTDTIKFIPPQGWKIIDFDHNAILTFSSGDVNSLASLGFMFVRGSYDAIFSSRGEIDLLKGIAEAMKRQQRYLTVKIINFKKLKAIKSFSSSSQEKDMQIQFFKDNMQAVITFSAGNEEFAQLLPLIEKSLETFEFISLDE